MTFTIKRGDTKPDLVITITDPAATFEAVESWRVLLKTGSTVYEDDSPSVVANDSDTPHQAVVTHEWAAEETATAVYPLRVEVEATWPDGSVQTFPAADYLTVTIKQDLG